MSWNLRGIECFCWLIISRRKSQKHFAVALHSLLLATIRAEIAEAGAGTRPSSNKVLNNARDSDRSSETDRTIVVAHEFSLAAWRIDFKSSDGADRNHSY